MDYGICETHAYLDSYQPDNSVAGDRIPINVRLASDNSGHPGRIRVVDRTVIPLEHAFTLDEDDVPIIDTFLPDEAYIISIGDGAVTADINGQFQQLPTIIDKPSR